ERELELRQPDVYFRVLRGDRVIADTRTQVVWNLRDPRVKIVIGIADGHAPPPPATPSTVTGRITTTAGVAVADVRVQAWDQALAGPALLATAVSDATGAYTAHYDPSELAGKPRADLYVRVLDPRQKLAEIARSAVIYQAPPAVTVNLAIAPAAVSRPSEYQRLLDATAPLLGKTALAGLDPGGVVYLAGRSAWDARTIAMAAQADTLSAQTKIPAVHYYALLRAGQPGDRDALALVPDSAVRSAIQQAIDASVIDAGPSIDTTIELHRQEAVRALQTYTTPVSLSSLGDMLAVSLDKSQTPAFLAAYHDTADQPEALWSTLQAAGFSAAAIAELQADGRLGFLTRQNAPLVARLKAGKVATDTDLARAGLYQADAWLPLIGKDVPAGLDAGSYAAGLAAQVQLGYPTLVVAELVRRGTLPVDQSTADADGEVAGFLRAGQGSYKIGDHPVKTWAGYAKLSSPAKDAARLVERLYQLTPSNDAMVALHAAGVSSAFQIATMPKQRFLDQIGGQLPDPSEA
ncbi:MAG TPA: hypothetical protein VH165_22905, partial [Kofleriaceae bacterium]|nr:hypothetical protein [Kofleriaceae bacterium]